MGQAAAEKSIHGNHLADGTLEMVPVETILPTPANPREVNEAGREFLDLVESVKGIGVTVPVCVRPHPAADKLHKKKWELLYGERRWRASRAAGLKTIPAIVRLGLTDAQAFEITFAENFARKDLTPLEEASAVATLLEKYSDDRKAVASKLGWPVSKVARRAHLTKLCTAWRDEIAEEGSKFRDWTAAHLELLAILEEDEQIELLEKWRKVGEWVHLRKVTSSELRDIIGCEFRVLAKAPWRRRPTKREQAEGLSPADLAGCGECMCRTGAKPVLFDFGDTPDPAKADSCTRPKCWDRKLKAWLKRRYQEEAAKRGLEKGELLRISTAPWGGGKGVLDAGTWLPAKKSDEDACPALVVEGSGLGGVKYVKPAYEGALGRHEDKKRLLAERAATKKETRKQEEIQLESELFIRQRVIDFMDGAAGGGLPTDCGTAGAQKPCKLEPPPADKLLVLAAVFGVDAPVHWQRDDLKRLKAAEQLDAEDLRRLLWCGVRKLVVEISEPEDEALPRFCELAGIDYAALEAEALAEIPDPEPPKPKAKAKKKGGKS